MAKILLLTLVFAPDGVSTSVLLTELALELQRRGHQVEVLKSPDHTVNTDTKGLKCL